MRVLMMTQRLDRQDEILGFTHDWVTALAAHVDHLVVVPVYAGDYDVPDNVTVASMGKEHGGGRLQRATTFYRQLVRHVPHVDALFSHMSPRYVLASAPVAMLYRKPITMWYTHRNPSTEIKIAIPLVKHIATAHETSFPIPGPKVNALGHGVDPAQFTPSEQYPEGPPLVLSLARLSPIKRHETLIRAAAILRDKYNDPPARFAIAGGRPPGMSQEYEVFLADEIKRLDVADRVEMLGAVPREEVNTLLQQASIAFNGSPPGLFDKSVLEGMLCGVPSVVANAAFDDLFAEDTPLLHLEDGGDAGALAEKLNTLLRMTPGDRREVGMGLHERTAAAHSLDQLAGRLAALMAS